MYRRLTVSGIAPRHGGRTGDESVCARGCVEPLQGMKRVSPSLTPLPDTLLPLPSTSSLRSKLRCASRRGNASIHPSRQQHSCARFKRPPSSEGWPPMQTQDAAIKLTFRRSSEVAREGQSGPAASVKRQRVSVVSSKRSLLVSDLGTEERCGPVSITQCNFR